MAYYPKLTEGSIIKILHNQIVLNPILQIMLYRKLVSQTNKDNNQNRYRFVLSDGVNFGNNFIVISEPLIRRIVSGEFEKFTVIQLNDYYITNQQIIDKQIIIIHNMTPVMAGSKIGKKLEISPPSTVLLANLNLNLNLNTNPLVSSNANTSSASLPIAVRQTNRSNICPINAITPYYNSWHIKARVTSKSLLNSYKNARGEGCYFSFDVLDQSGEIRIIGFNQECDKFYNMIEVNKIYYISKGDVKYGNKRFSNLSNDFEITLTQDSIIELCEEMSDSFPKMKYKFILIKDVMNCAPKTTVDVIGIVKSVDDVVTVNSRKTNRELKKRDITLLDNSGYEVRFTLWNELAEQLSCPINSVIALKNALVGDFNGKTLSSLSSTTIQVEPEIPETIQLLKWFVREGLNMTISSLSTPGGNSFNNECKYLCQINQQTVNYENRTYSNIKAKVSAVGRDLLYKACGPNGCLKKVRDNNNGFYHCDRCQTDSTTFIWRLILSICLSDCTGESWVTLFQDEAQKFLNISVQELSQLVENNPQEYQKLLKSLDFKQFSFRMGSRIETFAGRTRVKSVVYNFNRIDPVKESKKLLQNIKAWSN